MKKLIFGTLKLILCIVLGFFAALALITYQHYYGHTPVPNATRIREIVVGYENFLVDQGDTFEFQSREDLLSKLEGINALDIKYIDLVDHRDTWGRPLKIRPLEGPGKKIEIRSAGWDGRLDTEDDWLGVSPREKKGGE